MLIFYVKMAKILFDLLWGFYLPLRRRPGTGDIETPLIRLSVCLSVMFSFRTVTQKRITVFSRNCAGMCTMSWRCAVFFFSFHVFFAFFLEKQLFLISHFMLFPTF